MGVKPHFVERMCTDRILAMSFTYKNPTYCRRLLHALRLPRHHTTIEFYEKDITLLQLFPKPFHEERPRIELTNNLHSGLEISSTSHGFFFIPRWQRWVLGQSWCEPIMYCFLWLAMILILKIVLYLAFSSQIVVWRIWSGDTEKIHYPVNWQYYYYYYSCN